AWLITAGSILVLAILGIIGARQPSLFAWTMAVGAVAWVAGNLQWASGASIYRVVFAWMAFLVLTIAAERLELNRVLRPTPFVRSSFVAAMAAIVAGAALVPWRPEAGVRVLGAGLLAATTWLARNDVARRTIAQRGLTRYTAVCLLGGYAWLGV